LAKSIPGPQKGDPGEPGQPGEPGPRGPQGEQGLIGVPTSDWRALIAALTACLLAITGIIQGCQTRSTQEKHGEAIQAAKEQTESNHEAIQQNKEAFHDFKAAVIKEVPKAATPP
jgi:hypothetical protein